MRGDPPAQLDYLLAYYRGVHFATVALKGRLAKLGPEYRQAVSVVGDYQEMVNGFWEALKETAAMHHADQ
jgi:hypothetical protein